MRLALMQPYLFPYIGYFQLMKAVDTFVVYDDVQYMKGGWINRNRVLLDGKDHLFTFRVKRDSLDLSINKREFSESIACNGAKFTALLHNCYRKAPFYPQVSVLLEEILAYEERNVALFIMNSLRLLCGYLGINCTLLFSSGLEKNSDLKSQDRVIDIVRRMNADQYINAIGGVDLYDKGVFANKCIKLNFIKPCLREYRQFDNPFIAGLSIIDVCMFNDAENIRKLLDSYELI
jgi:hypothetical protein